MNSAYMSHVRVKLHNRLDWSHSGQHTICSASYNCFRCGWPLFVVCGYQQLSHRSQLPFVGTRKLRNF